MSNKINFTTNLIFLTLPLQILFVCNVYSDNKQRVLTRSLTVDEASDSDVVSCMRRIGNVNLISLVWIFNSNVFLILIYNLFYM